MDLTRLRDVVRGRLDRPPARELTYVPEDAWESCASPEAVASRLGGRLIDTGAGPCLVVERTYPATWCHGDGRISDWGRAPAHHLDLLGRPERTRAGEPGTRAAGVEPGVEAADDRDRPAPDARPPVFLDVETTGLAGGAGTSVFLIGCGTFDGDGFRVLQFFLNDLGGERALIDAVTGWLEPAPTIVTYNGKSFDAPVMEMRWLFHRQDPVTSDKRHIDMLHPARVLWRDRDHAGEREVPAWPAAAYGFDPSARPRHASCTLASLERVLLGVRRDGDVPGYEIPARYFAFVRSGDPAPLDPVLEHNRLDLLSLAGLTARALSLVEEGAPGARDPYECLGLGRLYERAGRHEAATRCYARITGTPAGDTQPNGSIDRFTDVDRDVRGEALRRLARRLRQMRRHAEAAELWTRIVDGDPRSDSLAREASEALAVHHEHRLKDLEAARRLARRALELERQPSGVTAGRHRLARLDRKLTGRRAGDPTVPALLDPAR